MATLKVIRPSSNFGGDSGINIVIDGEIKGKVNSKSAQGFEISPGAHTMKCDLGMLKLAGSEDYRFTLTENETKTLVLKYSSSIRMLKVSIAGFIGCFNSTIARSLHVNSLVTISYFTIIFFIIVFITRKKCFVVSDFVSSSSKSDGNSI